MTDRTPSPAPGDMPLDEFRRSAHALVEWIAADLGALEQAPVLARVAPGEIRDALPDHAPEHGVDLETMMRDVERMLVPGLTRWNHPRFFAYFPVGFSLPGVLGEFLSAALCQQAMLWRTSPAATELEMVVLGWLRRAMGLADAFEGVIYDTASTSTIHALAAARERKVPGVRQAGLAGRRDLPPLRVYCSVHAHSSVDKGMITLGLGLDALRRIDADRDFRMRPEALAAAIAEDVGRGALPIAVVATVGTTSCTSVDPVPAIAAICEEHGLWLHVDAAFAGAAAILPEQAWLIQGFERAHSIVVNPHKWLMTPFDLSVLFCRDLDGLRATFALVPEYLTTSEAGGVANLMDTGFQLGRRFRALKLWMVLRYFGLEGLRARLREHIRLAALFAHWIDAHPDFERIGPAPLSLVCFRAVPRRGPVEPEALDRLNERLMEGVNATGEVFLSHTRLDGRYVLRLAIGSLRTTEGDVARTWDLLQSTLGHLL